MTRRSSRPARLHRPGRPRRQSARRVPRWRRRSRSERRQAVGPRARTSARPSSSTTRADGEAASGSSRPAAELPFAGHPSVGTAWLLARGGAPARPCGRPAGDVPSRHDARADVDVRARPAWVPRIPVRPAAPRPATSDASRSRRWVTPGHVRLGVDRRGGRRPSGRATSRPTSGSRGRGDRARRRC